MFQCINYAVAWVAEECWAGTQLVQQQQYIVHSNMNIYKQCSSSSYKYQYLVLCTYNTYKTDHKLSNIPDISRNKNSESQTTSYNPIFRTSSKNGKLIIQRKSSENILCNLLVKFYPSPEINSVGISKETRDIIILRKNKPQISSKMKTTTQMSHNMKSEILTRY